MCRIQLILVISFFSCIQFAKAQCSSIVPNQNTIYGLTFNDSNQSGTKQGYEAVYAGVGLDLYQDNNANGVIDSEDVIVDTTVSAVDGNYTLVAPAIISNESVSDNFDSQSWAGNNGSLNWGNNWQEEGESGVTSGNVRVDNNKLRFGRYTEDGSNITGDGVNRYVDLTGFDTATLDFDFTKQINSSSGQNFSINIQVSTDGITYTLLDNITFSSTEQNYSYDISAYISANTHIRLVGNGSVGNEYDNYLFFDNIAVNYSLTDYYPNYIVAIDDSSLVSGVSVTTVSFRTVTFNGLGKRSCNNNFGVYVCGPNCTPNAEDDYTSMLQGESTTIAVLDNDTDGDNNIDASSLTINSNPSHGTVSLDGLGDIIYSPNGNFIGTDTFTYQICDSTSGTVLCDTATVTIDVVENFIDPCAQAIQQQTFYIPFSDDDLRTTLINSSGSCSESPTDYANRIISIKSPYPGSVITYDHWEDGYEADINNPVQATTQVWGDEDIANGTSPVYSDDYIPSGGDIVLENTYNYNPRNSTEIVYDGRDKIYTSNDVAISTVAGDVDLYEFQLAKTDVYSLDKFGTSFTVPFGEDLGQEFQYTGLFIRAAEDNTLVNVDLENDGVVDLTTTLAEGEVMFVDGGVQSGATISSDAPVGVDLFFGGLDCFGTRQINLYPAIFYGDVYYSPVPTVNSSAPSVVYFYNSLSSSINIDWNSNSNNGTINIGAKSSASLSLSDDSGYKFASQSGESYVASQVIDSDSSASAYDWAFNLISESRLTDFAAIAWAPGSIDESSNFNPVWVTPTANTTVYIKYDGDLTDASASTSPCGIPYDQSLSLNALNYTKILDTFNNDNDQSGLAVFTCDGTKLFAVYGEDPSTASSSGSGAFDVGTTMQPLCLKALVFANDDIAYGLYETPVTVPVSYNDTNFLTNIDLSSINTTGVLQPQNGTVTINTDGTVNYTPNTSFIGQDTFEYTICSLEFPDTCDTATVTVTIADCPSPSDKNLIYGQVFFDLNEDAINDEGIGIDGIVVNMYDDVNVNGVIDSGDVLLSNTRTNKFGFYNFTAPSYNVKVYDSFDNGLYNDGTGWSTNWIEVSDDSDPTSGDILVDTSNKRRLRLQDNTSIYRSLDLSGAAKANISFIVKERGKIDADDTAIVEICSDNTFSNCQTLFIKANDFVGATINGTLIEPDKITSNTTFRARVTGYASGDEYFFVDDILIRYEVNTEDIVLETDLSSLPTDYVLTTDNIEVANFGSGSFGTCEKSNDFGFYRCNLSDAGVDVVCDDNGTPLDATDDSYSITVNPIGTRLSTTYTISGDINAVGTYGTVETFGPFSLTAGNKIITITDDSGNCSIEDVEIEVSNNSCLFSDSPATLDFDGVDDHIITTSFIQGFDNVTIMGWVKPDMTFVGSAEIAGQRMFKIQVESSGNISALANLDGSTTNYTVTSSNVIEKGIWTHIAASYDGINGKFDLYIDGVLDESHPSIPAGKLSTDLDPDSNLVNYDFSIGNFVGNNSKFFKGAIDEVRVFKAALTQEQIQKMIYQEIEDNSGVVRGVIVPENIKDNAGSTIPWSSLELYYPMTDIENSLTYDVSENGRNGRLVNITTMQEQTAPMPYTTKAGGDGSWSSINNWEHGDVWKLPSTTIDNTIVKIQDDITLNETFSIAGLIIDDSKTLTIGGDNGITNTWYLELNGALDLANDSQLIQTEDSNLVTSAAGEILRRQEGTPSVYWYNYFSSPVGNTAATTFSDNNGTTNNVNNSAFTLNNLDFGDGSDVQYTSAHNATGMVSTTWLYKFENGVTYYDWDHIMPTDAVNPGIGYSQKGTGVGTEQQYIFKGKPNNGTILISGVDVGGTGSVGGTTKTEYLLGNPYPSALDVRKFIQDNSTVIEGTIFLWQQWSGTSHVTVDYNGGYAAVNMFASVRAYQFQGGNGGATSDQDGTLDATGYLPVGQGFFVEVEQSGDIKFQNSQRAFIKETDADGDYNNGSVFFRSSNTNSGKVNSTEEDNDVIGTFRLNFEAEGDGTRELVLGFSNSTTDGYDYGYDSKNSDLKAEDLNLLQGDQAMIMEAFSPITSDKVIPLVFKATGNFNYSIEAFDFKDIDASQEVYLRDNLLDVYHDLRTIPYSFTSDAGVFNNRFEIVFTNANSLSVDDTLFLDDDIVVYFNTDLDKLVVRGLEEDIKSLTLVNMLGQTVISLEQITKENAQSGVSLNSISTGAYVVQIKTDTTSGAKKVIIE